MMDDTKHAALPWRPTEMFSEHGLTNNDGSYAIVSGEEDALVVVCEVKYQGNARKRYKAPSPERDANAAFIVRAANAHDKLVDLVGRLSGALAYLDDAVGDGTFKGLCSEANEALRIAKGEQ